MNDNVVGIEEEFKHNEDRFMDSDDSSRSRDLNKGKGKKSLRKNNENNGNLGDVGITE